MKNKTKKVPKKIMIFVLLGFLLIVFLLLGAFYGTFPESSIYVPPSFLRVLVRTGLDVDAKDDLGFTPLHVCSMLGQYDHIKTLISCGADLEARNNQGWTALHIAVINYRGCLDTIRLLLESGADIEARTDDGVTPLMWAASKNDAPKLIQYLTDHGSDISAGDIEGKTSLHYAVLFEKYLSTKTLLSNGADIMAASHQGITPLESALTLKDKRFANLLTECVDVGQKDVNGKTPLHVVAMSGDEELAKVLIERGADIAAKDSNGENPLQLARMYNFPGSKIVEYLESLEN